MPSKHCAGHGRQQDDRTERRWSGIRRTSPIARKQAITATAIHKMQDRKTVSGSIAWSSRGLPGKSDLWFTYCPFRRAKPSATPAPLPTAGYLGRTRSSSGSSGSCRPTTAKRSLCRRTCEPSPVGTPDDLKPERGPRTRNVPIQHTMTAAESSRTVAKQNQTSLDDHGCRWVKPLWSIRISAK